VTTTRTIGVERASHRYTPVKIGLPAGTPKAHVGRPAHGVRHGQRRADKEVPLGRIVSGQIDHPLRHPGHLDHFTGFPFRRYGGEQQGHHQGGVIDAPEKRVEFGGESRGVTRAVVEGERHHHAGHADRE
jgi:hypothetical protein